ncbi:hypothetical protein P1J78_22245 [Psychromarinibacter sp. C21-152]|uniref:Uncharacterized protein n=1 Tax=Psychromarinibacter sediminicola TaxID=3033385 RepID=A0AAE3NWA9_9RHOB|nr:hypothetical protein [Psychromarinibacter sediminicola]MDF0603456.1 hypothetical protein [Psychromarinibacter sediminicola]
MKTDMAATRERLEQFAEWTGTEAPATILDDEGAPTQELLAYARNEELCLDWLFLGDVRPLVQAYRRRHEEMSWPRVQERVDLLAKLADMEPIRVEVDEDSVLLTDELIAFCKEARGDIDWLLCGKDENVLRSHQSKVKETEPLVEEVKSLSEAERRGLQVALRIAIREKRSVEEALAAYSEVVEEERAA